MRSRVAVQNPIPNNLFCEASFMRKCVRRSAGVSPAKFFCAVIPFLLSAVVSVAAQDVTIDSDTFSGLQARAIGPAVMGGRIADMVAIENGQRLTIYVGAAGGGVWKSLNGGTTFKPIFDKQPTQSIGSIAIDPSNPQTVWVGAGESWVRNSVSVGTGLYRARDGGENWELMGLPDSEH